MISLDNIDFYHYPPPPKPPARTSSSSDWKSYHLPSTPQSLSFSHPLSYPLPPKPPSAVTSVIPSTIRGHFQYAAPRNIFDIELENVSTRGNSPVVGETDLEAGHQSGPQVGNGLGDRCQDASSTLVASSMTSEPPVSSALQAQLYTSPQSPGDSAICSDPIITAAEADSGYSDGRSVSAVDDLPSDSDCLQLSLSGCDAEKHHNSQLPSPALSNPTSPENKCCARPSQHHEITFEDLPSRAAGCGEQTRALTVSASNSPTATPRIASSRDANTDCEDDNISVIPDLNWQPQRKRKQLRSNPPRHVLRSRVNTESTNQRDRPPSVAVVIPVRRYAVSPPPDPESEGQRQNSQ